MIERSAPFLLNEDKDSWGVLWSREVDGQTYVAGLVLPNDPAERVRQEWMVVESLEWR